MEKSHKIPLLYGYLVCLITIIVMLVTLGNFVGAMINLSDPAHVSLFSPNVSSRDLSSFEAYKIDTLSSLNNSGPASVTPKTDIIPSDTDLHQAYNDAKDNKTATVRFNAHQTITVTVILFILAALLFWFHWAFVNRIKEK